MLAPDDAAPRLGRRPSATTTRTRQLRGLVLDALGHARRGPVDDRAGARDRTERDGGDPDVAGRVGRDRRERRRRRRRSTSSCAAAADATNPQEQLRYLYALGDLPDRGARAARGRARAVGRGAAAERSVRASSGRCATASTARRCGCSCATTGTTCAARFSASLIPRLLDGVTWLVDDASLADVLAFLAEHPVPEGAHVIAQHLERQRVHRAAGRPRARPRLSAALLGSASAQRRRGVDVGAAS